MDCIDDLAAKELGRQPPSRTTPNSILEQLLYVIVRIEHL
jgi:hypothetical protein